MTGLSPAFIEALVSLRAAVAAVLRWQIKNYDPPVILVEATNPNTPSNLPGVVVFLFHDASQPWDVSESQTCQMIDDLETIYPLLAEADEALPPHPYWAAIGGYQSALRMIIDACKRALNDDTSKTTLH